MGFGFLVELLEFEDSFVVLDSEMVLGEGREDGGLLVFGGEVAGV